MTTGLLTIPESSSASRAPASGSGPVRVLELRSVRGLGGGPEKTILHGAALTDPARVAVTVCYVRDRRDRDFDIDRRARNLNLEYCEVHERQSIDPGVWPDLRRIVRERQIDIIHAHEYKTDVLAYLLAKAAKVIPLTTVHGWSGHSFREQWLYYPVDKWLLARFPLVLAVSDGVRRTIMNAGVSSRRIEVLLNGIDHHRFHRDGRQVAAARARFGLAAGEIGIGAVGRLEWLKRFDQLIDACAQLRSAWPSIRLLIAGEGSARAQLEAQIAARGLQHTCRLIGHTPDMVEFHHALDVFVQSSATEGAPNVVLEAMAMETPLVATDVGGTVELMRPGIDGVAVAAENTDALAAGIRQVLSNPDGSRRRAVSARARIERDLSFDMRVERLNRIYERLVGRSAASGARPQAVQQRP